MTVDGVRFQKIFQNDKSPRIKMIEEAESCRIYFVFFCIKFFKITTDDGMYFTRIRYL